jgi:hypothetical protein
MSSQAVVAAPAVSRYALANDLRLVGKSRVRGQSLTCSLAAKLNYRQSFLMPLRLSRVESFSAARTVKLTSDRVWSRSTTSRASIEAFRA